LWSESTQGRMMIIITLKPATIIVATETPQVD
jgi:hypothetical protein